MLPYAVFQNYLKALFKHFLFLMCALPACMSRYPGCGVPRALIGQKTSDPLELEIETIEPLCGCREQSLDPLEKQEPFLWSL